MSQMKFMGKIGGVPLLRNCQDLRNLQSKKMNRRGSLSIEILHLGLLGYGNDID